MINLQTGPSQLFHSVRDHVRQAFKLRIPEMLPESDEARELVQQVAKQLKTLLDIPNTHDVLFLPETASFVDEAIRVSSGNSLLSHDDLLTEDLTTDNNAKLFITRHTERSGTSLPQNTFARLREKVNDKLVAVDASLAWPYASLPLESVDAVFLEFHFGFGMPAGLGAAVVNERWQQNLPLSKPGAIHPALNLTWVSVLGGVLGDMLSRGIITIRREIEYKSSLLYHLLDQHPLIQPIVKEKAIRSRTLIGARSGDIGRVESELRKHAISACFMGNNVWFANFPSHSKEQYERLADILSAIR
ncbi:MAG TPA: hypothetical protein VIL31_13190 [Cyclobacteriaceae bacterium]|jgi:phosphoserine aminotransferase